ncbi:MAG TPA: FGGY family carbohydrate kinase [Phycisphaerae bacterium]|nr:FGGY family carbohydrate kinase [Phycisphaerae bacterium]
MAEDVLLGIDLGTTVLKAAVLSARSGKTLGAASVRLPVRCGGDGMREQDLDRVDAAVAAAAGRLRRRLGRAWARIAGIGLAAQGGSAIIVDAATGKAHTSMQLWNDSRPMKLLDEIAARRPRAYWKRLSCLDAPGAGLARIEWLRRRRPGLFRQGNLYVGAGEYLYFKLTGAWRQDAGNALQIGCYDARRRRLAAVPLRLVGVPASFVAPMRRGHETHPLSPAGAKLLHLPAGVPVAGPYMDHEAGFLSAAGASGRPLQLSLGTAWVGNFVLPSGKWPPEGFNLLLPSPLGAGSLVVRVTAGGNISSDWAMETFVGRGAGALSRADAIFRRSLLPPPDLTALPWLTRANVLDPAAAGAGGFLGVGPHTSRHDLLRAMAAAMCFELARVFEPIVRGGTVGRIVLTGGAASGWHFRELLSVLFAPLPISRVAGDELAGARGAVWTFSKAAARARTEPCPAPRKADRKEVLAAYEHYCRVCEVLARGLGKAAEGVFLYSRKEKRS